MEMPWIAKEEAGAMGGASSSSEEEEMLEWLGESAMGAEGGRRIGVKLIPCRIV